MTVYESQLASAKINLVTALVNALENGVTFARALEILGVDGKPAVMLRAMLSRYNEAQLAEMLAPMAKVEREDGATLEPISDDDLELDDRYTHEPPV